MNADLCPDLVFLGDGAVWIWNLVTQYYPNARQIVDWYHAEEHLEVVATAAFSDLTQRASGSKMPLKPYGMYKSKMSLSPVRL